MMHVLALAALVAGHTLAAGQPFVRFDGPPTSGRDQITASGVWYAKPADLESMRVWFHINDKANGWKAGVVSVDTSVVPHRWWATVVKPKGAGTFRLRAIARSDDGWEVETDPREITFAEG